jgi:hypothetical protein
MTMEIEFGREGRARTRIIRISTTEPLSSETRGARPSAPSAFTAKSHPANDLAAPDLRTVASDAGGNSGGPLPTVRGSPLKTNSATVADGADADAPLQSGSERTGTPNWSVRL